MRLPYELNSFARRLVSHHLNLADRILRKLFLCHSGGYHDWWIL